MTISGQQASDTAVLSQLEYLVTLVVKIKSNSFKKKIGEEVEGKLPRVENLQAHLQ